MPEMVSDRKVFTLSEVLRSVQKTLTQRYTSPFWVKAEMNKLNYYRHSGHCYPDLVEKSNGRIAAEVRAILWSSDYQRVNQKFIDILHEPLKDGIKILFCAQIQFDPRYGLSLKIIDIDPSFTLGDLEREKQETLQRLQNEGLFNLNKELPIPLLPQRIAVISVETSKGYADFQSIIHSNPWGYQFFYFLFPSLLQGDRAAEALIAQLNRIRNVIQHFDVVTIIRGGGGEVGLTCYNNYELARTICQFPLPVITGIGHSTNTTVAEMVAHTNAITPTKVAELLIQYFHNFSQPVDLARNKIIEFARKCISDHQDEFAAITRLFKSAASRAFIIQQHRIENVSREFIQRASMLTMKNRDNVENIQNKLNIHASFYLSNTKTHLEGVEKNLRLINPDQVLKRGYSITTFKGKIIRDAGDLLPGDEVKTLLAQGGFRSRVVQDNVKQKDYE